MGVAPFETLIGFNPSFYNRIGGDTLAGKVPIVVKRIEKL